MELAANYLKGKHNFSTFRSSICQASSAVKTIDTIDIQSEKIRDGIVYQINFSGIALDSLKVKKNDIFFAIKGKKFDGNNFISQAIKKGAKVIISQKKNQKKNTDVIFLYSSNPRKLLAEVSYKIYDKDVLITLIA